MTRNHRASVATGHDIRCLLVAVGSIYQGYYSTDF